MRQVKNDQRVLQFRNQDSWAEAIENLVARRDYVTYDEILSLLPDIEEHLELLDDLLDELNALGVSVVEQDEVGKEEKEAGEVARPSEEEPTRAAGDLENIQPDDSLSLYLAQMALEPLLTHEEEIELGQQIELGRQAERALEETDYMAEKFGQLQAQAEAGQAARERLGRANTRLVVSIAKRYRGSGVPFADLIQSGNVGLMRAVDRYDYRTGYRFSTYATWWIRQSVIRSLANHGRIIRIPVHTVDRLRKMARVVQRLEQQHGRRPTTEEIGTEMDQPPAKIRQLMHWATRPVSLEKPVGDERDTELSYFVEDKNTLDPEEMTDIHLLSETVKELLSRLTAREERILRLRYGLQDGRTRTLKQVGDKLGLSRERVRQIEREALTKMRLTDPGHRLRQFSENVS